MKLIRVLSDTPAEAADLISFLEINGYNVRTGDDSDPNAPLADIEIDLRVLPVQSALNVARELMREGDALIAPGIFVPNAPEHSEPEPAEVEAVVAPEVFATVAPAQEAQLEEVQFVESAAETQPEMVSSSESAENLEPLAAPEVFAIETQCAESQFAEPVAVPELTTDSEALNKAEPLLAPEVFATEIPAAEAQLVEFVAEPEPEMVSPSESSDNVEPLLAPEIFATEVPAAEVQPVEYVAKPEPEMVSPSESSDNVESLSAAEVFAPESPVSELQSESVVEPELVVISHSESSIAVNPTPPNPINVNPIPAAKAASARIGESWAQVLCEARLTGAECFALIAAELVSASEYTQKWLAQTRVLLVRKHALVEARAMSARFAMETRLRFDPRSQSSWLRSAVAGAGLMVFLLMIMLWNAHRAASFTKPATAAGTSSLAGTHVATPEQTIEAESADSESTHQMTAKLNRHGSSERSTAVAPEDEVIIRHFARPRPKPAVATDNGIKHFSDIN